MSGRRRRRLSCDLCVATFYVYILADFLKSYECNKSFNIVWLPDVAWKSGYNVIINLLFHLLSRHFCVSRIDVPTVGV